MDDGGGRAAATISDVYPESFNDERVVDLSDDDPILPDMTRDDTAAGWGELAHISRGDDDWLREERPPHWD